MDILKILEVGIGLALLFLFMSLIASAISESIEAFTKTRATDLEKGIQALLRDSDVVKSFYDHHMIYSLYKGEYGAGASLPSYIPKDLFAIAVIDIVTKQRDLPRTTDPSALADAIDQAERGKSAMSFESGIALLLRDAGTDMAAARKKIEDWYDASMNRVSGWYIKRTKFILFWIGLVSAILFNVDPVTIARVLYDQDDLRAVVVAAAQTPPEAEINEQSNGGDSGGPKQDFSKSLDAVASLTATFQAIGYPIGWYWGNDLKWPVPAPQACKAASPTLANSRQENSERPAQAAGDSSAPGAIAQSSDRALAPKGGNVVLPDGSAALSAVTCSSGATLYLSALLGWIITAFAITLGAPFWFDTLKRFMTIRSSIKPEEQADKKTKKAEATPGEAPAGASGGRPAVAAGQAGPRQAPVAL